LQNSNKNSSFPQPPPAFQPYPGPAPPVQAYQPQAGPPPPPYPPYAPNQQYGAPGPQPTYNPPPQPYSAPPTQQYGRPGYQPPPYNQYPQLNGPPQYIGPGYQAPQQQYVPPATAPYQPPNPYTQPSAGYVGNQQGPPTPYQPPQSQWTAPPLTRPPYQQPRRSNSFQQREFSTTPSQQSQPQQLDYGSEGPQRTPQTPASNPGSNQQGPGARQGSQSSPTAVAAESKIASSASTPHNQQGPNTCLVRKELAHESITSKGKEEEDSAKVESETAIAEEDDDEQFDWDFKYIFKEPERKETVALAQPLSANFKSTPVPLVQAWSIHIPSISRYARKDNLKEFVRSIRSAPQWSFLQEDPGFSDATLDGPLIPLSEVPAWTAARHKKNVTPEPKLEPELENEDVPESRKRLRSEEPEEGQIDEQDDVDNPVALEASEIEVEGPPVKRQKNEESEAQLDEIMETAGARTPVLGSGRDGTPCLATDDDAWAPQPGECATSPVDPTEALLASLGVSGSPKPVKQESLPPYLTPNEDNQSPQKQSQTPVGNQQSPNGPSPNVPQSNGPPMNNGNAYANTPQSKPQWSPPNAPYANGLPANPPFANGQYGPSTNVPYANAPPPYVAPVNPQYGPPVSAPYGPPNGYSQGPPQPYGPPRNPSYGSATSYNNPQGYPQQYGLPANYQQGPPQYGQPPAPYAPPNSFPQGPPQYVPQRNPSFGNGPPVPGPYSGPQQSSPVQYGPSQNVPYNTYPNPPQQYGSNGPQGHYENVPQTNAPYPNGPPVQPPYGNVPPRQDSGYVSARGSYSNGSGPAEPVQQNGPQNLAQPTFQSDPNQPPPGFCSSQNENKPPQQSECRNSSEQVGADTTNSNGTNSTAESGNSPLSPTSAEILGKLVQPTRKDSGDRPKSEAARKIKRPQPIVADAYRFVLKLLCVFCY